MADYRLNGPDESNGVTYTPRSISITNDIYNPQWQKYLEWKDADPENNIPDPQYTTEQQDQIDYENRQDARLQNLKSALINQFKMILALFQVGRDKGVWTVSDFDSDLVTVAQQWIALIDEYENDEP